MKSFLKCKHTNVQQFTEVCLNCGYNIHMTEAEYRTLLENKLLENLRLETQAEVREACEHLEKELGIKE